MSAAQEVSESAPGPVAAWNAARGIRDGETIAVATMYQGRFTVTTRTAAIAARGIEQTMTERDCWVSANPMLPGLPTGRKGSARDVTRWACLHADLDVKPGGMPDWPAARAVIDTLATMLGVKPAAVVMTGHGLQPVWCIEQESGRTTWDSPNAPEFAKAQATLKRFGALVQSVAKRHGGDVDNVFNLDRVLRAPGTTNRKAEPVQTTLQLDPDPQELTLDRLIEVLDAQAGGTSASPATSAAGDRGDIDAHNVGPKFADLPESEQARLRRVIEGAERGEATRLAEAATWSEDQRNDRGAGWEKIVSDLCARFGALALAPWSPWTMQDAEAAVRRAVPPAIAAAVSVDAKWSQQWHRGVPAKFPEPRATVADLIPTGAADLGSLGLRAVELGQQQPARPVEVDGEAEFWDSHPTLKHVEQFALARMTSPWAVLAVVLARQLCSVPPRIALPPTIGSRASLNLFAAVVSASGGGKGATMSCAAEAVTFGGMTFPTIQPGSGEGIAHAYAYARHNKSTGETTTEPVRESVLFEAAEIDTLAALMGRNGSTLGSVLRSVWMGEQLGHGYVAADKRLLIPAHTYRAGMIVGVQPARAGALFDEQEGGTPQRFLWVPASDARITADPPPQPEPLHLPGQSWPSSPFNLTLPAEVESLVRQNHAARMRGEGDALDGHAILTRLKVAAGLTFLLGRRLMLLEDWERAGVVMAVSDRTRASVQTTLSRKAAESNVAKGKAEGARAEVASSVRDEAAQKRAAANIKRTVEAAGAGGVSRGDARRAIRRDSRDYFDPALDALVTAGNIEIAPSPRGKRLVWRADQ